MLSSAGGPGKTDVRRLLRATLVPLMTIADTHSYQELFCETSHELCFVAVN